MRLPCPWFLNVYTMFTISSSFRFRQLKMLHLQLIVVLSITALVLGDSECDKKGILIYDDLGCTPHFEPGAKCPHKFTCDALEPDSQNCYYRGVTYKDRELLGSNVTGPACQAGCVCLVQDGKAAFRCAILDCPEWLGSPLKPGCYRKYNLNHCCSAGQTCPPFDGIATCSYEGKEYQEGDRFYPKNTCLKCVCQKGFQGKLEAPFCQNTHCGQQLLRSGEKIQQACAPFYAKDDNSQLCCPDDWICPDGSEQIKGDSKSDEFCKFGQNATLKVGQSLTKPNLVDGFGRSFTNVKCECVVPPLLRCTKT